MFDLINEMKIFIIIPIAINILLGILINKKVHTFHNLSLNRIFNALLPVFGIIMATALAVISLRDNTGDGGAFLLVAFPLLWLIQLIVGIILAIMLNNLQKWKKTLTKILIVFIIYLAYVGLARISSIGFVYQPWRYAHMYTYLTDKNIRKQYHDYKPCKQAYTKETCEIINECEWRLMPIYEYEEYAQYTKEACINKTYEEYQKHVPKKYFHKQ